MWYQNRLQSNSAASRYYRLFFLRVSTQHFPFKRESKSEAGREPKLNQLHLKTNKSSNNFTAVYALYYKARGGRHFES